MSRRPPISRRAAAIQPTQIRRVRELARPTSLDLGLGQTDLAVDVATREAIAAAVDAGRAPYVPNAGIAEARAAVARHYDDLDEPGQVMITCGVQEALAVAILGLVEPGDEVLVPDPGFPAYPNLVAAADATPVPYRLDADAGWRLDPDVVDAAITERTRAIVLNTPSNPTGAVHDRDDLEAVLDLCARRDIVWISDEIYEDYIYGDARHHSPTDFDEHRGRGVRLSGLSKSHHTMGWRLGWLTGEADWVDALTPLHQHLVTSAPSLVQRAVPAALAAHRSVIEDTLAVFEARRALALEACAAIPGVSCAAPQGAFYLFVDVGAHLDDFGSTLELAQAILDEIDVVTVPGAGFGEAGRGHLRLAYTVEERILSEALERIQSFFEGV